MVWDFPAKLETREMAETDQKTRQGLTPVMQTRLQRMQDKFQTMSNQVIGKTDDVSTHIDDVERKTLQISWPRLGGTTGKWKQDTCYTEELKVVHLHWNLEHCFYKPKDQMAFATNYYVQTYFTL